MHSIDVAKGQKVGTVSAQWANRPDDERFTDLPSLHKQVLAWRNASFADDVKPGALKLIAAPDDPQGLVLTYKDKPQLNMSHFGFQQLANVAKTPPEYMRRLPPELAALNVNYGLRAAEQKAASLYLMGNDSVVLRGITSTRYGRIYDSDVVEAVAKLAGNGTGDTHWKVPGTIDWCGAHGITYNPMVDVTKENTTLYASDRDIFLFLVDDLNPIEAGKLANGDPDLMFRGFYVWNSEVGQRTFGVATMYLRGVCQNRMLWGIEGFKETVFKHSKGAPELFLKEAAPALEVFAKENSKAVVAGVAAAKAAKVSVTDEDRIEFLAKFGFSERQARALIERAVKEEGAPPESVWDHAQAVSAQARGEQLQERRIGLEQIAGKMLDKVKVKA